MKYFFLFFVILFSQLTFAYEAVASPIVFKTLLIIKSHTVIPPYGSFQGVNTTMTDVEVNRITQTYRRLAAQWVSSVTSNEVSWETEIKISNAPTNPSGTCQAGGFRVLPKDLNPELSRIPTNRYDSIFFYVDLRNGQNNAGCVAGDTFPKGTFGPTGISVIYADRFDAQYWRTQTFTHEWGHQLTAFYSQFNVPLPYCGANIPPIHCAPYYSYQPDPNSPPGLKQWSRWLTDFYIGRVSDPKRGYVGLGSRAWVHGTFLNPVD